MTDHERDPDALDESADAIDDELATGDGDEPYDGDEASDEDLAPDDDAAELGTDDGEDATVEAAPAAGQTAASRRRGRERQAAPRGVAAPGPSDVAVHVDDRVSAVFVLVVVGVFVAILLNGALFGVGGLVTGIPTPVPTASPTVAPSVSSSPAPSPTGSPSAAPSPSVAPSVEPSPVPSSVPSPAFSPSPVTPGTSASPAAS